MARNSSFYPTEWQSCTLTSDEVDRLAELERKISVLRFQMLTGFKKDGQSIAELQNQTLEITNDLFPPLTVGRHYIGGGRYYSSDGRIDKFTHSNEVVTPLNVNLQVPRIRHAGAASTLRGYWAGGRNNSNSLIADVEGLAFESEQNYGVSANLPATGEYGRGSYSQVAGYFAGITAAGRIDKMPFSTETPATLGASLPSVHQGNNVNRSESKSYHSGGWVATRAINTVALDTDTTAALAALLSVNRHQGGNFESATSGYVVAGGNHATYSTNRTVDRVKFSDDSCTVVSDLLTAIADTDSDGASAQQKGYWFGGFLWLGGPDVPSMAQKMEAMNFSTEKMYLIGSRLTQGGMYPCPVGRP